MFPLENFTRKWLMNWFITRSNITVEIMCWDLCYYHNLYIIWDKGFDMLLHPTVFVECHYSLITQHLCHYSEVIMIMMASEITGVRLLAQLVVQAQMKENIKVPHHWPLWGESTGDWWIFLSKDQLCGKCFHLMMSSCGLATITQIAKFMGPTWGPPGSCRPQMGPMLAPWTLLSGRLWHGWLITSHAGVANLIGVISLSHWPSEILCQMPGSLAVAKVLKNGLLALEVLIEVYKTCDFLL